MTTTATLLVELLTEELPPKALPTLASTFSRLVSEELIKLGFTAHAQVDTFATPRRLAFTVARVLPMQPESTLERRGPAVANAFNNGEPTPALLGFARSCGVAHTELEQSHDEKQAIFVFRYTQAGISLASILPTLIEAALKKLPVPKMMRWGAREGQFIRPIHGLIMLHGDQLIVGNVLNIASSNTTLGHRFLSQGPITIPHADSYADTLHTVGKVIACFETRRQSIRTALIQHAEQHQAILAPAPGLLDEVTALVEWPVVHTATFDGTFLTVPQECLILSMQQHQRYFALLDMQEKLLPYFLMVANIDPADPRSIIQGNERVLHARLSDAQFFYHQDHKYTLASRVPKLADVVYHHKLGSQLARITRLQDIAGHIAGQLGINVDDAKHATYLAKADLLTDMVSEFPALQGIMGKYYAQHDGEPNDIAQAIASHYQPRFAGDDLPQDPLGQVVALADKLESIVGIYGIGLSPTGDKDPFGLRRAALGVIRLLLLMPLNLHELLTFTAQCFPIATLNANLVEEISHFMQERLKHYLSPRYPITHIEAVLISLTGQFDRLLARLDALAEFLVLPEAQALASADKRIRHILKKYAADLPALRPDGLTEVTEKILFAELTTLQPIVNHAIAQQDYTTALKALAILREPVDNFFTHVMVMVEDQAIRENRLALLSTLAHLMNKVADLSLLTE